MNYFVKKPILATIVSALGMFMFAGLWNLLIFPRLGISFAPGVLRQTPIFPLIITGYFTLASVLVYIGLKSKFSHNRRWHWIITGMLVMEVAFGFSSLVLQANYNFPLKAIPLDLIWYAIEGMVGGYIISLFSKEKVK